MPPRFTPMPAPQCSVDIQEVGLSGPVRELHRSEGALVVEVQLDEPWPAFAVCRYDHSLAVEFMVNAIENVSGQPPTRIEFNIGHADGWNAICEGRKYVYQIALWKGAK